MPQIMMNDFSGGWRPSDDIIGGPVNSLVRMQNLKLDEIGALTLIPGSAKVNAAEFANSPHSIYSKVLGNTKYRFVGTSAGEVLVDSGNFGGAFNAAAIAGGSPNKAVFGSAYNMAIICSGPSKVKFDPAVAGFAFNLGPGKPTVAPTYVNHAPYVLDATGSLGSYSGVEGIYSVAGSYGKISPSVDSLNGVAFQWYGANFDTTNLSGGSQGTPEDLFSLTFQSPNTSFIQAITVTFRGGADANSYFSFRWDKTDTQRSPIRGSSHGPVRNLNRTPGVNFNVGANIDGKLQCARGDFTASGQPKWTNLSAVSVSVECLGDVTDVSFKELIFSGGSFGPINGDNIQYMQVNINDRHGFTSYSAKGPETKNFVVSQGSVTITPQDYITPDIQNSGWAIFRRGGGLGEWFQVRSEIRGGLPAPFDDTLSDEDAIKIGIRFNEFLQPISSIGDAIIGIVGPFFNRMLYFTWKNIYISQDGNPEMYATNTGVLSPYANTGEVFMWAEKFGNSVILVGTSNDIYELTGTFSELPDGTIDASVRPTGSKNPPINDAVAASANALYYVASDGIRKQTAGNEPFWPQLDLLFKQSTRYGIVPPLIRAGNQDKYELAISKNELYLSVVDTVGARKMWVYDLLKNYCYEFKSDDGGYAAPIALYTEEDGNLLAAFTDSGNKYLRVLNTGNLIDGTTNPVILMRTKSLSGEAPRNRKDSFTLKLKIDTGSSGIEVKCYKDESTVPVSLGFINTAALVEQFIDLSALVGVCKSYQIEISGNAPRFKLTDFSIDFELRPAPLSYFRSQPTNFGVQGRKRVYELPIVIDTISSPVTMTPYIDGVAKPAAIITTNGKVTYNYQFGTVGVGRDFYFTLLAGAVGFEYYGEVNPRVIEPLPDSVKTLVIPATNLGTSARKRFLAYAFKIDTNGQNIAFVPSVDGVLYPQKVINTLGKRTYIYYFDDVVEGIDILGTLTSAGAEFEFYEVDFDACISEKLPPSADVFLIPSTNLGTYARKRFLAFAFIIDTKGYSCTFIPYVDGVAQAPKACITNGKRTYIYYFDSNVEGIDIGGKISFDLIHPFEFYQVNLEECVSEKLPPSALYFVIPATNLGTYARKRFIAFAFIINTKGANVAFTPTIDSTAYPTRIVNTLGKATFIYYFDTLAEGVDIKGVLSCPTPFEFYGLSLEETVSEKLPASSTFMVMSNTNLGTYARKRFIAFAFVINTFGQNVIFTPAVDGRLYPAATVNTTEKRTYVYYFEERVEGIDIGGKLDGTANFEFYQVALEECISEKLPSSADYLVIPYTNFGLAAKKRIRAIPLVLDTRGNNVIYTPIIDGVPYPPYTFNTTDKRTVMYYFTTDAFGIDIGGTLVCNGAHFEFYGIRQIGTGEKPEIVEAIPVGKLFDQLGPIEFLRSANIKGFRVRMIAEGTSFSYKVYIDDVVKETGVVTTLPNIDKVYEVPWITKFLNGTTCRIEISAGMPFHRYGGHIKASITGSSKLWMAFKSS